MKKIFLFAATAAMILSSCSESEVTEVYSGNDNTNNIGFQMASFATKNPNVTTSGSINTQDNIVKISSQAGTFGTLKFTHNGTKWAVENNKQWSSVKKTDYPLYLYSANNGVQATGDVVVTPNATDGTTGTFECEIDATVANQKDIVCFGQKLTQQPGDGIIHATFIHALSRVYVTANLDDAGVTTVDAFIAGVKLVNVSDKATATITPGDADAFTLGWNNSFDDKDASFAYLTSTTDPAACSGGVKLSADTDDDMYILPQELIGPDKADPAIDHIDFEPFESYVEVIYRWNLAGSDIPVIGANNEAALDRGTSTTTNPLYVKVAFPLTKTFENNKMYNIILPMAGVGNGGYLLSTELVDKEGNDTGILVDASDSKVVGDPVLKDGPIELEVEEVKDYTSEEVTL